MKFFSSLIACVCVWTAATGSVVAAKYDSELNYSLAFTWPWASHSLDKEINNLNRMRGHLRWLFRNYKSNADLRSKYLSISHDIDDINARFKQPKFDKRQLHLDVEHAHSELHHIELTMRVKPHDYFEWK